MVALAIKPEEFDLTSQKQAQAMCYIPCIEGFDDTKRRPIEIGNAYDIIVVESADGEFFSRADFFASFPNSTSQGTLFGQPQAPQKLILEIGEADEATSTRRDHWESQNYYDDDDGGPIEMQPLRPSSRAPLSASSPWKPERTLEIDTDRLNEDPQYRTQFFERLGQVLQPGTNPARYLLFEEDANTESKKSFLDVNAGDDDDRSTHPSVVGVAFVNIFVWSHRDKLLISDIDGTITTSNTTGIYDTILTEQYAYCHDGICQLYSSIVSSKDGGNNAKADEIQSREDSSIRVVYLTSRPVALASCTRRFLENLQQGDGHRLPRGPILGFHGNFPQLLWMELVSHRTQHFKADRLWKNLVQPFREAGASKRPQELFIGAIGNTLMDVQAYFMVGVNLKHTFLIDKSSRLHAFDKDGNDETKAKDTQTISTNDLCSNRPGPERPKAYFESKRLSQFEGYGDARLLDRFTRSHPVV